MNDLTADDVISRETYKASAYKASAHACVDICYVVKLTKDFERDYGEFALLYLYKIEEAIATLTRIKNKAKSQ